MRHGKHFVCKCRYPMTLHSKGATATDKSSASMTVGTTANVAFRNIKMQANPVALRLPWYEDGRAILREIDVA